jgi:hypothetical protein
LISYHCNQINEYVYDLGSSKKENLLPELNKIFGDIDSHKLPIRGVVMAENDGLMATNSFDSVKIWKIDFMAQ